MIRVEKELLERCNESLRAFITEFKRKAIYQHQLDVLVHKTTMDSKVYKVKVVDPRTSPPFVVGYLGYNGQYSVESSRIHNGKYASYRDDYNRKYSGNLKTAVKTARDTLKPFSWDEVASKTSRMANTYLRDLVNGPSSKINDAVRYTISSVDIVEELMAAMEDGRTFKTDKFNVALAAVRDNHAEAARLNSLNYSAHFVSVDNTGRYVSTLWATPLTEEQVPECIKTKISLLKLVSNEFFYDNINPENVMPEVGARTGAETYWVFLTGDELQKIKSELFTPND